MKILTTCAVASVSVALLSGSASANCSTNGIECDYIKQIYVLPDSLVSVSMRQDNIEALDCNKGKPPADMRNPYLPFSAPNFNILYSALLAATGSQYRTTVRVDESSCEINGVSIYGQ